MRPYQITATERILTRINIAYNYHYEGSIKAGGYIWHTTGSGKTLTSFKTAQLAADLPFIDKVLFVVDRKDLDYQTMKEYDRFEKGCADGNTSTKVLERQLSNQDRTGKPKTYRIIITTIQKLANFVKRNPGHPVRNERIVMIFDECHRSQFGDMHKDIVKFFKKYYLFGFTGTPIFSTNAAHRGDPRFATTSQLFGGMPDERGENTRALHTYTIVNAINDENVLPFRIDYINTMEQKEMKDQQVEAIATETALLSSKRIALIVDYVLEHFDQKTKKASAYKLNGKYVKGFNSIFAAQSVPAAIKYYDEFRKQAAEKYPELKIVTIFTYAPNEEEPEGLVGDEDMDTTVMDASSRDALDRAIMDYNLMFHTNFSTDGDRFENYYKDLSQRMKNREIDILIVVNMFLTGFDATTLNTLWVDKNLKMHGLIQAFSRTNRILNSVKNFGNIVCFRNLSKRVDDAIALFGDENAGSIVLLKDYASYYNGFTDEDGIHHPGYKEIVDELLGKYPITSIGIKVLGEQAEKDFISLFGNLLRIMNILNVFDRFAGEQLLTERQLQDYQSKYVDLYDKYRKKIEREDISDDIEFEIELAKQIEVNIDYILALVKKYHDDNCLNAEAVAAVMKAVDSSLQLRSKKLLIEAFLNTINTETDITGEWKQFAEQKKEEDLQQIITEEKLKEAETRNYLEQCFAEGQLRTSGTMIDDIMPPVRRFGGGNRAEKKQTVIDKLTEFFERYFGI